MQKKYSRSHIGEIITTKQGYRCEVIDGGTMPNYCTIKIEDWIHESKYYHAKNRAIKYPYHKTLHNIGYLGEGEYKSKLNKTFTEVYTIWAGLIKRCYSVKSLKASPTYRNVTVCKEWHNFQTFAKWFHEESNYQEGWHLDKDILSVNSKIYSPETCIFIPQALNSFTASSKSTKDLTSQYTGVSFYKLTNKFVALICVDGKQKCLGYFNNTQFGQKRAAVKYRKARKIEADKWREKMKNILPEKVIKRIR